MKQCKRCLTEKPISEFAVDKARKDGLHGWCKKCKNQSRANWRKNNLDKDRISKQRYAIKHADIIAKRQASFKVTNPDYYAQKAKEYRERLGEKYNKRIRRLDRQKRKNDPLYAMKRRISGTLYTSIVKRGFKKRSKSYKLLGCSYEEFKFHIESQFDLTMNWNNYGTVWTYDHICPCSQAQNETELIKLQHFTNWRPYKDNFKKSDLKTVEAEIKCKELLKREWI